MPLRELDLWAKDEGKCKMGRPFVTVLVVLLGLSACIGATRSVPLPEGNLPPHKHSPLDSLLAIQNLRANHSGHSQYVVTCAKSRFHHTVYLRSAAGYDKSGR